jgi:hypothetical protein
MIGYGSGCPRPCQYEHGSEAGPHSNTRGGGGRRERGMRDEEVGFGAAVGEGVFERKLFRISGIFTFFWKYDYATKIQIIFKSSLI